MKAIVTSLGMIVFVAAIVASGTGAFFNDTETSTGNVFTAGAIDLTVDSEAHYNGSICLPNLVTTGDLTDYTWQGGVGYPVGLPCTGTWAAKDLGAETFFNFNDVKPGDEGENTISLHITSNPAWACVDVDIVTNDDMSSNEPELATGDATNTPDTMDGELAQNIKFASWLDQGVTPGWQGKEGTEGGDDGEGDNVWQGDPAEPLLFSNKTGPASDVLGGKSYALADATTGFGPMTPNVTNYIGLAWCAGTQVVDSGTDLITCDGSTLGNVVQTDSMEASIGFRVEQARNNERFVCDPQVVEELPATLTVDKVVGFSSTEVIGVDVTDFQLTIDGPVAGTGDAQVVVDQIATPGLPAGTYTISEVYSNAPAGVTFNATFSGACSEIGDTGVGTMNLVAGSNVTCTITNIVDPLPQ